MLGPRRRASALMPVVLGLALVVLGLVGLRLHTRLGVLDRTAIAARKAPDDFFVRRARSKMWTESVVLALVPMALAGGVGAAAYFMFRRRTVAAEIGMAIPLTLAAAALVSQAFNTVSTAPGNPSFATPPDPLAGGPAGPAMPSGPSAPAGASSVVPPQPAPAPRPMPDAPAPPTPEQRRAAETDATASRVTDEIKKGLAELLDGLALRAEGVMTLVAKPPRHDKRRLAERIDAAKAFRAEVELVRRRLASLGRDAKDRLRTEGLNEADALAHAVRFESDFGAMRRSFACDAYLRLCDDVEKETSILDEAFAKWKSAPDGAIDTADGALRVKLSAPRFGIESAIDRKNDLARQLRGE